MGIANSNVVRTCDQTLLPLYCERNVVYSVFFTAVNYVSIISTRVGEFLNQANSELNSIYSEKLVVCIELNTILPVLQLLGLTTF